MLKINNSRQTKKISEESGKLKRNIQIECPGGHKLKLVCSLPVKYEQAVENMTHVVCDKCSEAIYPSNNEPIFHCNHESCDYDLCHNCALKCQKRESSSFQEGRGHHQLGRGYLNSSSRRGGRSRS